VVGERGFEPPTSASRTLRANQAALLPEASYDSDVATTVARGEEASEQSDVLQPLFTPWFDLDDARRAERPRRSGFWGTVGQFLFDYNRF
jgi:hypothetical protein